jgi:hypothetical protein
LAKQNLPHPSLCPLCDQAKETIQHLLTSCVFAREFWFQRCVPDNRDQEFTGWWRKAAKRVSKEKKEGFNTLIILGTWLLWKHRNACAFEGASPSMNGLASRKGTETWCFRSGSGDKLAAVDSLYVVGQVAMWLLGLRGEMLCGATAAGALQYPLRYSIADTVHGVGG